MYDDGFIKTMKILTVLCIFIIVCIGFMSFQSEYDQLQREEQKRENVSVVSDEYMPEIVIFDGCEYFKSRTNSHESYTHKGNCKNPIHKYNVER